LNGNPKPPEKEIVCRRVSQACRQVDTVSVGAADEFGKFDEWMI